MEEVWRRVLDAVEAHRGVASAGLSEEQLAALRARGLSDAMLAALAIGYPTAPVRIGMLDFFPPLASLAQHRRLPELFDAELLEAAADFLEHAPAGEVVGRETLRSGELVFWLPRVERALVKSLGEQRATQVLQRLGRAARWDDYRAEIDKRLLVARSFFLIGLVIAVYLLARHGSLPGRLVGAGASLLVVGVGLGLAPWLRENARLRELEER